VPDRCCNGPWSGDGQPDPTLSGIVHAEIPGPCRPDITNIPEELPHIPEQLSFRTFCSFRRLIRVGSHGFI
jgi:hypothetical protein